MSTDRSQEILATIMKILKTAFNSSRLITLVESTKAARIDVINHNTMHSTFYSIDTVQSLYILIYGGKEEHFIKYNRHYVWHCPKWCKPPIHTLYYKYKYLMRLYITLLTTIKIFEKLIKLFIIIKPFYPFLDPIKKKTRPPKYSIDTS